MKNKPIRILHLEDLVDDAELVARSLKKAGLEFEIKVVDSKSEFETAIKEFKPEIVISDHSLPLFNSIEALHILKDSGLKIPLILVTGAVTEDFAIVMMANGIAGYILKDKLHRLPDAVLEALERFRK